jgi:hypothetical protein
MEWMGWRKKTRNVLMTFRNANSDSPGELTKRFLFSILFLVSLSPRR